MIEISQRVKQNDFLQFHILEFLEYEQRKLAEFILSKKTCMFI